MLDNGPNTLQVIPHLICTIAYQDVNDTIIASLQLRT